jgi:hypothetical protein
LTDIDTLGADMPKPSNVKVPSGSSPPSTHGPLDRGSGNEQDAKSAMGAFSGADEGVVAAASEGFNIPRISRWTNPSIRVYSWV